MAECQICQEQRIPLTQYGIIPWGDQPAIGWRVDYTGLLPLWKGECFVLTGVATDVGDGFVFLPYTASAKITIRVLTECLILHHGISHSIASDPGTYVLPSQRSVIVGPLS